jgi:hypothetical protein
MRRTRKYSKKSKKGNRRIENGGFGDRVTENFLFTSMQIKKSEK